MSKKHTAKKYLQKNFIIYIVVLCVFVTAVILGAVKASKLTSEEVSDLTLVTGEVFSDTFNSDYPLIVKRSIIDNLKIILICLICSFSVFTMLSCVGVAAFKGFSTGFTAGFIISQYKLKGLLYILSSVVPHCIFEIPILLFMCGVCISFAVANRNARGGAINFFTVMFMIFLSLTFLSICDGFFSSFIIRTF